MKKINVIFYSIIGVFSHIILAIFKGIASIFGIKTKKDKVVNYYECLLKKPNSNGYEFEFKICDDEEETVKIFENLKSSGEISDYCIKFDSEIVGETEDLVKNYPTEYDFFDKGFVYCIENKLSYPIDTLMQEPTEQCEKSDVISLKLTHNLDRELEDNENAEDLINSDFEYFVQHEEDSIEIGINFETKNQNTKINFAYKNNGKDWKEFAEKIKTQKYTRLMNNFAFYKWIHVWEKENGYLRILIQTFDDEKHCVNFDAVLKKDKFISELDNLLIGINRRIEMAKQNL